MLFSHHNKIRFSPIDPLGDGLREEIAAEQAEPEHFDLDEHFDSALPDKWEAILVDARQDPDFVFADDEA